jgi:hypothetical protein
MTEDKDLIKFVNDCTYFDKKIRNIVVKRHFSDRVVMSTLTRIMVVICKQTDKPLETAQQVYDAMLGLMKIDIKEVEDGISKDS